jgi:hypothetical protein
MRNPKNAMTGVQSGQSIVETVMMMPILLLLLPLPSPCLLPLHGKAVCVLAEWQMVRWPCLSVNTIKTENSQ